jgi:succinyl-CoA synthetase beta subunit
MLRQVASSLRRPCFGAGAAALPAAQQSRALNVHEYVGIQLLSEHGVATPKAETATSAQQAEDIVASGKLGDSDDVVIKAQVLAGGRGQGTFKNGFKGGVHIATS